MTDPTPPRSKWRFVPLILIAASAGVSVLGFGLCASSRGPRSGDFGATMFFAGLAGIAIGVLWGIVVLILGLSNKRP